MCRETRHMGSHLIILLLEMMCQVFLCGENLRNSGVNAPGTHVPYFRASCGLTNR